MTSSARPAVFAVLLWQTTQYWSMTARSADPDGEADCCCALAKQAKLAANANGPKQRETEMVKKCVTKTLSCRHAVTDCTARIVGPGVRKHNTLEDSRSPWAH